LVPRAGQASGRLVVGITVGGPAEQAGLRVGDVLLSLDGHTTSGPNALRAFLEGSRIGNQIEVRILRDGNVATARLTVGEQP
jgi:serine protease Do